MDLETLRLERGSHNSAERGMCVMEQKLRFHTVVSETGCHLWEGYTQPNGYGYVNVGGRKMPAHRLSLILSGTNVPQGLDVCHRCDVRNCVNPEHLYVGTRKQNMADCTLRVRHNKPSGETHWSAKLSAKDVADIRQSNANGERQTAIARRFKVAPSTVSRICRREWRREVA